MCTPRSFSTGSGAQQFCLPFKQAKKRRTDEADLKAAPSPSRRSDPDLDITEIGDIRSDDGQYGSGGCLNARRPTSMGGAYWAEFWVAVIIYIEYRRARARALLEAVPPVFEIKWDTDEASFNDGIRWEGVRGRRPDCSASWGQLAVVPTQLRRLSDL